MRTLTEYREAVASFAREAFDEAKETGNDASDIVTESVDGSDWIIYTGHNLAVLIHTDSDEALFDEMGSEALAGCEDSSSTYQRIAFWAMRQDVMDYLSEHEAEWEEEGE